MTKYKKILIFVVGGIGDFILATSAISLVKQYEKDVKITLVMCEEYIDLVSDKLQVDNIITLKHKYHIVETHFIFRTVYKILWNVKNWNKLHSHDLFIMLHNSKIYELFAKYLYGIKNIINSNVLANTKMHAMFAFQTIVRSALPTYNLSIPILPDTDYLKGKIKQNFLQNTKKYKIALCTRTSVEIKNWKIEYFDKIIKLTNNMYDTTFFVVGVSKEEVNNGEILRNNNKKIDIRNLCSKTTLLETKELLSDMDLLISVDTSVVHLAAINNIKTISFYGFSSPTSFGAINYNFIPIFLNKDCSPCDGKYFTNKLNCKDPKCMNNITPEMVFEKVKQLLINL